MMLKYGTAPLFCDHSILCLQDAHNCIPELDSETAMFSVYDGHGGEEVALYCAKYLPEVIKSQKAYKDGKLQKALEDAFLAIDQKLTQEEVIKELAQMAGRPINDHDCGKEKVADEDDVDNEEAALLHEEATMTIEELLTRYGQNCAKTPRTKAGGQAEEKKGPEEEETKEVSVNGDLDSTGGDCQKKNGKSEGKVTASVGVSSSGEAGGSTSSPKAGCLRPKGLHANEPVSSSTGEAGPSCSSSPTKPQPTSKSKFFEDSEESEAEEEEDSEECSEEDYSSEEAENEEEDEEDSEDAEEEEDEEMMLPGMAGKEEPGSDSGTTAVVALIRGKQLIVANAGDSRCVVSEGGKALDMSYDHKPEDELELARIKNAGGKVTMDGRVNGGLNLSRAIGDHFYKRNKNLPPEEQMISALPDIKVVTLSEEHEFMVLACDGIWNVMSSQEVVDFVHEKIESQLQKGETLSLTSIVEELLDQCLAPDTSGDGTGCDNMTCIIIDFRPHCPPSAPEAAKRKVENAEESEACTNSPKKPKRD
uniref:Protein phosphatase 1G n=1 Tax=Xenopus tropicalis TaxID=8364 RepID=A0A6I8RXF2_XENTR